MISQEIQYAKSKSHAIAKLDGTFKQAPMKKIGSGAGGDQTTNTSAAAAKREREADSDSGSEMSE